jgi:hypothetical protein
MGFQNGHIFVESIYCFFAQVDGVEAEGRGEEDGRQDRKGDTHWPH